MSYSTSDIVKHSVQKRLHTELSSSRETNKKLRLDAIVCRTSGCDFARVVEWGTPSKPALISEIAALHAVGWPDHSLSLNDNVVDGMLFATDEEIRVGRAWLLGLAAGRREVGAKVHEAVNNVLNQYSVKI